MNSTADLRLPFAVRPLTPNLGAEILGVKLADGISDELFKGIYQAFLRYQVLLFPPNEHASFTLKGFDQYGHPIAVESASWTAPRQRRPTLSSFATSRHCNHRA